MVNDEDQVDDEWSTTMTGRVDDRCRHRDHIIVLTAALISAAIVAFAFVVVAVVVAMLMIMVMVALMAAHGTALLMRIMDP